MNFYKSEKIYFIFQIDSSFVPKTNFLKNIILIIFMMILSNNLTPQSLIRDNYGVQAGISFQFGSTVNRLGLFAKGFVIYESFQLNTDVRWHFNIRSFGPPISGGEWIYKVGLVWSWGKNDTLRNEILTPVSNQIGKKNSIGYSFNQYRDQIGTTQKTGLASIQLNRLQFIIENDAFAGAPADKFRTAAATFQYRLTATTQIGINSILWTGDPFTNFIDTQTEDATYPSRYGYRDMRLAQYGKYSHGILSMQLQQVFPYQQAVKYDLGIDSEYIRHALQNVVIHDMYYVPDKINLAKHPHIPMVSDDGTQFLFRAGQKVKPLLFFGQLGLNSTLFY